MISAGANYGRGIGETVNRRATFLGASATTKAYLRTVQPLADNVLSSIGGTLSTLDKTVWTSDNN